MIGKTNATAGGLDLSKKPDITFDGTWFPWFLEFYDGEPYWEAWFLSSGTLTPNKPYVVDAWGIGGGGQSYWGVSAMSTSCGTAGIPNMRLGISLSKSTAVTIGAGGHNLTDKNQAGGNTMFGDHLTCNGGAAPSSTNMVTDSYKRYRFEDPSKASEAGNSMTGTTGRSSSNTSNYYAQGGWTKINRSCSNYYVGSYSYCISVQGDGFGGGGGYRGISAPGALVIRIKI